VSETNKRAGFKLAGQRLVRDWSGCVEQTMEGYRLGLRRGAPSTSGSGDGEEEADPHGVRCNWPPFNWDWAWRPKLTNQNAAPGSLESLIWIDSTKNMSETPDGPPRVDNTISIDSAAKCQVHVNSV
jgi:hypothetical protein